LIENPVFIGGRVWEANSIAQLQVSAINNDHDCWVYPLSREGIPTHLNLLCYPQLTGVIKTIKEKLSSTEQPQECNQASSIQAPMQRQAPAGHEDIPFFVIY
jgi:hypothetical protein